ncbi:hypothetical protein BCR33DRAFT_735123 [Rhizoclosmatium globosum]|uniref:Uncharacterized protein n=1 Tax=Rhizoclosmatium globosum TaxID=329046 RepID=A0A1Y2CPH4_9FUNG|nr:hypothetical protein BCR33DRAFT_735123 [Rhizoclosmatium globosum]|eukprot:ORY48921.1 hypothetical protein BCR33DRAFT_735123 [Rhizoclosmatium globosum]
MAPFTNSYDITITPSSSIFSLPPSKPLHQPTLPAPKTPYTLQPHTHTTQQSSQPLPHPHPLPTSFHLPIPSSHSTPHLKQSHSNVNNLFNVSLRSKTFNLRFLASITSVDLLRACFPPSPEGDGVEVVDGLRTTYEMHSSLPATSSTAKKS